VPARNGRTAHRALCGRGYSDLAGAQHGIATLWQHDRLRADRIGGVTHSSWHTQWVTIDGTRLRVATTGDGPPLLLLMGIGGNLEMWGPLAEQLPGRRLIAFDAPGTGESSIGRLRRMTGLADLTAQLLDALGLGTVDVLGYSFGGALAQQLAHRHPDRVGRLILGATMCGLGGIPARPDVYWHMAHPLRYRSQRYLRWVAPQIYGGRARRPGTAGAQSMAARLAHPPSTLGYLSQLAAMSGWSSLPWLSALRMPVLVLAGDDDPIIPLINARILAWRIPDAQLHIVPDGGHLFLLDQSEDVIGVIESFLAESGPESSGVASAAAIAL
jgi:poly(3-hydroxyoctanoate) depolymerase